MVLTERDFVRRILDEDAWLLDAIDASRGLRAELVTTTGLWWVWEATSGRTERAAGSDAAIEVEDAASAPLQGLRASR